MDQAQQTATTPAITMQVISFPTQDRELTELRGKYSGLTITDDASYKVVSFALRDVVSRRCAVTDRRRDLKRSIDVEAKRILALLEPIEKELKDTKQAEDDRREAIKREKEEAEAARISAIQAKIDEMATVIPTTPQGSESLMQIIMVINKTVIMEEVFQEFTEKAEQVKEETLSTLHDMLADRIKWEEEEETRKKEMVELRRLKAENERLEAERKAREESEEKSRQAERQKIEADRRELEAETARVEAEKRAEQERKDREKREAVERIESTKKARFEMLLDVGFTYPFDDLGTMPETQYTKMFDEHNKAWQKEQNKIFLENMERERLEHIEFERIAREKAEREALEKLEQEKAEQIRQEALKPDKEKLTTFANFLEGSLPYPEVEQQKSINIKATAFNMISDTVEFIRAKIENL
jgi:hypothetical protein